MPPVPKRNAERRRVNKDGRNDVVKRSGAVRVPPAPRELHPIARRWYLALRESGQSAHYEPSDWAAALYVADAMTRNLHQGGKFSSVLFSSVWGAMNDLLTTEQARRRARIEVERDLAEQDDRPQVTAIDEYRKALG